MNKFNQENIFSLKNKNILIIGGMGLIGLSFADSQNAFSAKVFILNIKKSHNLDEYSLCRNILNFIKNKK